VLDGFQERRLEVYAKAQSEERRTGQSRAIFDLRMRKTSQLILWVIGVDLHFEDLFGMTFAVAAINRTHSQASSLFPQWTVDGVGSQVIVGAQKVFHLWSCLHLL
jgi:hypothetical protein